MGLFRRREGPHGTLCRGWPPRGGGLALSAPSHPPAAERGGARTSQLLLPAQLHLLLVHAGVDGPEVGHDGQEVLKVNLVSQAAGPLAQVPLGAARGRWKRINWPSSFHCQQLRDPGPSGPPFAHDGCSSLVFCFPSTCSWGALGSPGGSALPLPPRAHHPRAWGWDRQLHSSWGRLGCRAAWVWVLIHGETEAPSNPITPRGTSPDPSPLDQGRQTAARTSRLPPVLTFLHGWKNVWGKEHPRRIIAFYDK